MNPQSKTLPSARVQLSCQWERFSEIANELLILSRLQQAEVGEDYEPYSPDWNQYFAFERGGSCAVWTARVLKGGTLAGYVIWLTVRGLHSIEHIFAKADLVYLLPEWRDGLTGYRFLKSAVNAIEAQHPDFVHVETNDLYKGGRMGVLLKRLGFRRIGSVWQRGREH